MYWFSRPPYLRWAAAISVLTIAAYMDLTGPPTEPYPFTAAPAVAGEPLEIEWRRVPIGLLPPHGNVESVAAQSLRVGTPLLIEAVDQPTPAPRDWWAMAAPLPIGAASGGEVLVTTRDFEVTGIIIEPGTIASFGSAEHGVIAVPPTHAAAVAAALGDGTAHVLIRP